MLQKRSWESCVKVRVVFDYFNCCGLLSVGDVFGPVQVFTVVEVVGSACKYLASDE
jgi:hypothetical protein